MPQYLHIGAGWLRKSTLCVFRVDRLHSRWGRWGRFRTYVAVQTVSIVLQCVAINMFSIDDAWAGFCLQQLATAGELLLCSGSIV